MKEKAINGSIKKIALVAIFLIFLVGTVSAEFDITIDGIVPDYKYGDAVFAYETNSVNVVIENIGDEESPSGTVYLNVSDVNGGSTIIASAAFGSIAEYDSTTVTLTDSTPRYSQGTITYSAYVVCSDEEEYMENSTNVRYNGYKGKRYWTDASDIDTVRTYEGNGNMSYFTQPSTSYKSTKWTTRTETWTTGDLYVPASATIIDARLYISYNWDNTTTANPDAPPAFTATFNTNPLSLGTPYTDKSNFGDYGDKEYGLFSINVTNYYNRNSDNNLVMTADPSGYTQALYPSTLVVIYSDLNETYKQIFVNEECDELAVADTTTHKYGTTEEEATAYAPFTLMTINNATAKAATLYSFAGSAGSAEGNLIINGNTVATNAWTGNYYTASPLVYSFPSVSSLFASGNEAGIQGTEYGGMLALQNLLVVEY